jgi:homoserine O-acetyltransferase
VALALYIIEYAMGQGKNISGSVGRVETRYAHIDLPSGGLCLEGGGVLPELTVAYEAYGALSPQKNNVVFLCHALSGSAHAAGFHEPDDSENDPAWWDNMVGPGKGIDTRYYHVICANVLGGCKGTTGPVSINPQTGQPYGADFPLVTVGDMITVQHLLLQHLGIEKLAAVIGGSFGGMQVLEWAIRFPDMVERCVCIAAATSLSAQGLAFDIVGRTAITNDLQWQDGHYLKHHHDPACGLALARKVGHITYLSPEAMAKKFGRERRDSLPSPGVGAAGGRFRTNFQMESYLEYQGAKFVKRFDANSYLHITWAMDAYDLEEKFGTLEKALAPVRAKMLVVAYSSDWLFPPEDSQEIANALLRVNKQVSYCMVRSTFGHDGFLADIGDLQNLIRAFLPWVETAEARVPAATGCGRKSGTPRRDFETISEIIRPGARVLDLGCGNGELLACLTRCRNAGGINMDIDLHNVIEVLERGHDIFQEDIDTGLAMVPDGAYDYAILSETMQVVKKPRFVLQEMLQVAREGIVSFPNFGNWEHRLKLLLRGRMPKNKVLAFEWYDTPNIHLFTLRDFEELCRKDGFRILKTVHIAERGLSRWLVRLGFRNLGAERVLIRVARG